MRDIADVAALGAQLSHLAAEESQPAPLRRTYALLSTVWVPRWSG